MKKRNVRKQAKWILVGLAVSAAVLFASIVTAQETTETLETNESSTTTTVVAEGDYYKVEAVEVEGGKWLTEDTHFAELSELPAPWNPKSASQSARVTVIVENQSAPGQPIIKTTVVLMSLNKNAYQGELSAEEQALVDTGEMVAPRVYNLHNQRMQSAMWNKLKANFVQMVRQGRTFWYSGVK